MPAFGFALWLLCWLAVNLQGQAAAPSPLATFDYRVVGTVLRPVPQAVSVPRNIAGSVNVQFVRGDGSVATELVSNLSGARLEATLRGPSYPAQRVVGEPGQPLLLPALRVAGDYQLEDLRVVRSDGTFLSATPSTVPVKVFEEVLVSKVTSRPLSLDEIRDKGIAIDESSFRAVEFDVTLVLQGRQVPVRFPVVAPAFKTSTEIIPAAELEDRSVRAEQMNRELLRLVKLPDDLKVAMPDFTVTPVHFEPVGDGEELERKPPQITGLLVIPGNIGSLNQFFSVQLYTENASPSGSGLAVNQLKATIRLPTGRDTNSPIDDPLRLARVGPDKGTKPTLPVTLPGPDGKLGTDDDITRLQPGEAGQAEFLVEGLVEGLHLVRFDIEGDLEGLAAGTTRVKGTASGSVLVRNTTFSFTFSHPRTVRAGEPYEASVTLMNTSDFTNNLVSVSINREALSGTVLLSDKSVQLGNLGPGESATATFRFRSQRTGSVLFSNLTTGDDNTTGRLQLTCGVDERGVALNADSIGYPDWWNAVPEGVRRAADRVLGQALSAATAARLPAGVLKPGRSVVEQRVIEFAEAGQRLRYGDEARRVLLDLALDWHGGRVADAGFDQIVRLTDAGREWRAALALAQEEADFASATARLSDLGPSLANLGQSWWLAAGPSAWVLTVGGGDAGTESEPPVQSGTYSGARGAWASAKPDTNTVFRWRAPASAGSAAVSFLNVGTDGTAELLTWTLAGVEAGAVMTLRPGGAGGGGPMLETPGGALAPQRSVVRDEPSRVLSVRQDISVTTDRAWQHCPMLPWNNWGTVVAALYNKPMRPEDVAVAEAFRFADGNGARTVQLQPGGRVALLQLHRGIGSFPPARPRQYDLMAAALPDPRGQAGVATTNTVAMETGHGVSVRGRVIGLDGLPAGGIPVTLTMRDLVGDLCLPVENRAGQVFTDDNGFFAFDFVLADVGFDIAALDTRRMSDDVARGLLASLIEAVGRGSPDRQRLEELARDATTKSAILKAFNVGEVGLAIAAAEGLDRALYRDLIPLEGGRDQTELNVVLRFRGRGTVAGRVLDERGQPLSGAAVNLYPDADSRELARGMFSDAEGRYEFTGVPLGTFSLDVATSDQRNRTLVDRLLTPGQNLSIDVVVPDVRVVMNSVRGQVLEANGTPNAGATVYVAKEAKGGVAVGVVAQVTADANGFYLTRAVPASNYVAVAVSGDGLRTGNRPVSIPATGVATANIQLQSSAVLRGIVRFWDGRPAARARVGGGDRVVRADENGRFTLPGVPMGLRSLIAGLDGSEVPDNITRTGNAQVRVLPEGNDEIEIRLGAYGRIRGLVTDGGGVPVAGVRVAIPTTDGFYWVKANSAGEYVFDRMPLGAYTVSAPSPPVKQSPEELAAAALDAISNANSQADADAAAALVGQLVNVYSQGTVGRFTAPPFDPGTWGFNRTTIRFDGHSAEANIVYMPSASLEGVVLNHQGVPIGAEVHVSAFGPNKVGAPAVKDLPTFFSDPASGRWSASGFLIGAFRVFASSPLLVGQPRIDGVLSSVEAHRTNVVLQFPPQKDVTGRIVGFATNPDGSPVTNGMVHIDFTSDYAIVVTNGGFDTQIKLPERYYTVTVTNIETQLVGQSQLRLEGGRTNYVTVRLLDQGALRVRVAQADGTPARGARVTLSRYEFPVERDAQGGQRRIELGTDVAGEAEFGGLWEGAWSVQVRHQVGANTLELQAGATVEPRGTNVLELRLGASGSIVGRFVEAGSGAPVPGANVTVRFRVANGPVYANAPTDAGGNFIVPGLPVETYHLTAENPVTGRRGTGSVVLRVNPTSTNTVSVTLVEEALGEVLGTLVAGDGLTPVVGAEVVWSAANTPSGARRVTTGPDGAYRFPGVPVGRFTLQATSRGLTPLSARADGELTEAASPLRLDLKLPALGNFDVTVLEPDGSPATNSVVAIPMLRSSADTDAAGIARFRDLTLGRWQFTATSRNIGQRSSVAAGEGTLVEPGATVGVTLRLSGVGRLAGVLRDSRSQPAPNARVQVLVGIGGTNPQTRETLTGGDGRFAIEDIPFGPWKLTAVQGAVAAFGGGVLTSAAPEALLELSLGGRGTVIGSIARENGLELVGAEVTFEFTAQGGGTGFKGVVTGPLGRFVAADLPLNTDLHMIVSVPSIDGRAFRTTRLPVDGSTNDLGTIRLDQHAPEVTDLFPPDGAVEVHETNRVAVTFSEWMDPATITNRNGLYLLAGTNRVPAQVAYEELPGPTGPVTRMFLTPREPLASRQTYTVVLLGGDAVTASGQPAAVGPEDAVHRALLRTLVSTFSVRDYLPPVVLSEFPAAGATEIEPAAVVRFEFDEAIRTNQVQLLLRTSGGVALDGRVDLNPNQRLLTFVPLRPLDPNSAYRAELRGVEDLAGNVMTARTNAFETLDTRGPKIASFELAPGQRPVPGATVSFVARLEAGESGASVEFLAGNTSVGLAVVGPNFTAPVRMPDVAVGSEATFTAVGIDRLGNRGEPRLLTLRLQPNEPPVVSLSSALGGAASVSSGGVIALRVAASDDGRLRQVLVEGTAGGSGSGSGSGSALGALRWVFDPASNRLDRIIAVRLPSDYVAGDPISFRATARDDSGAQTDSLPLVIPTLDATPPLFTYLGPTNGARLDPRVLFSVPFKVLDNSASVRIEGQVTLQNQPFTNQSVIVDLAPNAVREGRLDFDLRTATNGGFAELMLRTVDAAGNAASETHTFTIRNVTGPRLERVFASSGHELPTTVAQSPLLSFVQFNFSKVLKLPLDPAGVVVTNESGTAVPFTLSGSSSVRATFTGAPLNPGGRVYVVMRPGFTDADGNGIQRGDGSDFPPDGVRVDFPVAASPTLSLTNGTPVVPGQTLVFQVLHAPEFAGWSATINGAGTSASVAADGGTLLRIAVPTNAATVRLDAMVSQPGRTPFTLPGIDLAVVSREDDSDGDGLPNGWEADRSFSFSGRNFNPFSPGDAKLDYDFDGLDNVTEYRNGTELFNADTDGDGLLDARESALRDGCPSAFRKDSDGDGFADGVDEDPCDPGESLTVSPLSMAVTGGAFTTNQVVIVGRNLRPQLLAFTMGAPVPPWASVEPRFDVGSNSITRSIVLRPSAANVGEYDLPLTVRALRASQTVFSNVVLHVSVLRNTNIATTRWKAPVNGNWETATNWTAGLPGPGTNAVIDLPGDYTVTIQSSVFVESLRLGAGGGPGTGVQTLFLSSGGLELNDASSVVRGGLFRSLGVVAGQGGLSVAGNWVWEQFSEVTGIGPIRIEEGGLLRIVGPFQRWLRRPLENHGEIRFGPEARLWLDGVNLVNSGTIEVPGMANDGTSQILGQRGSRIVHSGLLRLVGTNTVYFQSIAFEHRGTVDWTNGTWRVDGGGTNATRMDIPVGGRLELSGGWTHLPGAFLGGAGSLLLGSGTNDHQVPLQLSGALELVTGVQRFRQSSPSALRATVRNATVQLDAPQVFETLDFDGASILGSGDVTVRRQMVWTSGTMEGAGRWIVDATAAVLCKGTSRRLNRDAENLGRVEMEPRAEFWMQSNRFLNRGTIASTGAIFSSGMFWSGSTPAGQLVNEGRIEVVGPGDARLSGVAFDNLGIVTIDAGRFSISGATAINRGRVEFLGPGASLGILGGNAFVEDTAGVMTGPGSITLSRSSMDLRSSVVIPQFAATEFSTLHGSGAMEILQRLEWRGSNLTNMGGLRLGADATAVVASGSGSFAQLGTVFENLGSLRAEPATRIQFDRGVFRNLGRFEAPGAIQFTSALSPAQPALCRFENAGTLVKGTNAMTFDAVTFANRGLVEFTSGLLQLDRTTNETTIHVPAGGLLRAIAAAGQPGFIQSDTGVLAGPGTYSFESGVHAVAGRFEPGGGLTNRSGTLQLIRPLTNNAPTVVESGAMVVGAGGVVSRLDLLGGNLTVADRLDVVGDVTWGNTDVKGGGTLRFGPAARVVARPVSNATTGQRVVALRVENAGDVVVRPLGNFRFGGGTWVNESGARVLFEGGHNLAADSGTLNRFINAGTIAKTNAGVATLDIPVENTGLIDVAVGELTFSGGGLQRGALHVVNPARISFGGTDPLAFGAGVDFTGNGAVRFQSGVAPVLEADLGFGATQVTFEGTETWTGAFRISNGPGGMLTFKTGSWRTAGPVEIGGNMLAEAGAIVRIDAPLNILAGGHLENRGTRSAGRSNIRVRPPQGWPSNDPAFITGLPPDVIPAPIPLQIVGFDLLGTDPESLRGIARETMVGRRLRLRWRDDSGVAHRVESSVDLIRWDETDIPSAETAAGQYEAVAPAPETGALRFYRVIRRVEP